MERMNQELNIENYTSNKLKKLFNEANGSNTFLNSYTLLDIEEGKKRLYVKLLQKYNYTNKELIESFVENASKVLSTELFSTNNNITSMNTEMVGVKNIIKDPRQLNKNYFNETYRIISIDSLYRSNIWYSNYVYDSKTSSDMIIQLNDTLDNVVSLELTNICIPYTFYNIDSENGNNYFYVEISGNDNSLEKLEISSGSYNNASLVTEINTSIQGLIGDASVDLVVSINTTSNKITITNTNNSGNNNTYNIIFYDYLDNEQNFSNQSINGLSPEVQSKINNNLGWLLGFRSINNENNCLEYLIGPGSILVAESLCYIPYTKYFVISIDDLNKNQTNKGLVQISNGKQFIKQPKYFKNIDSSENDLRCLTDSNCNTYVNSSGRALTKNQIYSALQINNYRASFNEKNSKIDANTISNVFAIVPFENKSLVWGESIFTSDKNRFKRKYNGPVNISKLHIKLMDDKGNLLNLNGGEWSFTMMSTHLYQY